MLNHLLKPRHLHLSILYPFCQSIQHSLNQFVQNQSNDRLLSTKIQKHTDKLDLTIVDSPSHQIVLKNLKVQVIVPNVFQNIGNRYQQFTMPSNPDIFLAVQINHQFSLVYTCQLSFQELVITHINYTADLEQYFQQLVNQKYKQHNGVDYQSLDKQFKQVLKDILVQNGINHNLVVLIENIQLQKQEQALDQWTQDFKQYFNDI